ncbi:MAG: YegS/Rv2252/BmrU family lipid kinase [Sphingobacteriales bacterium]|nr:MAG: YegS/Rv2252/BmrU family lipid kinase [Sphingobacteriales bacterium]
MNIAFIINGNIRKIDTVIKEINSTFNRFEIQTLVSNYAGHIDILTKESLAKNIDTLVFVGGDGSLNEGINALIDYHKIDNNYNWEAIAKIKIAVYPAGSGNDFIKTLYKEINLQQLKNIIEKEHTTLVDVGQVFFKDRNRNNSIRFFINITDVGMGGNTVQRKEKVPKWLGADISYFWSITSTVATYKPVHVRAYNSEHNWEGKIINYVVANGKYFGNGLCIAPDANITDGEFSIVIIGDISLTDYFKNLGDVKKGKKIIHEKVKYISTKEINIESPINNDELTIDMDGEFIGYAPMKLVCLKHKLSFLI